MAHGLVLEVVLFDLRHGVRRVVLVPNVLDVRAVRLAVSYALADEAEVMNRSYSFGRICRTRG